MFKPLSLVALAAVLAMPTTVQAAPAEQTATVMTLEQGSHRKPPFKRRFETLPVTDVAVAEPVSVETVTVRTVVTGANKKAPFKRTSVTLPVTDVAAMDTQAGSTQFRGRPPFKRHR